MLRKLLIYALSILFFVNHYLCKCLLEFRILLKLLEKCNLAFALKCTGAVFPRIYIIPKQCCTIQTTQRFDKFWYIYQSVMLACTSIQVNFKIICMWVVKQNEQDGWRHNQTSNSILQSIKNFQKLAPPPLTLGTGGWIKW